MGARTMSTASHIMSDSLPGNVYAVLEQTNKTLYFYAWLHPETLNIFEASQNDAALKSWIESFSISERLVDQLAAAQEVEGAQVWQRLVTSESPSSGGAGDIRPTA